MLKLLFLAGALSIAASVSAQAPGAHTADCQKVIDGLQKLGNDYKKLNDPDTNNFIEELKAQPISAGCWQEWPVIQDIQKKVDALKKNN